MATEKGLDQNEVSRDAVERSLKAGLEEQERKLQEDLKNFSEAKKRLGSMVDEIGDRVDELEEMTRRIQVQEVYEVFGEAPEPESGPESES